MRRVLTCDREVPTERPAHPGALGLFRQPDCDAPPRCVAVSYCRGGRIAKCVKWREERESGFAPFVAFRVVRDPNVSRHSAEFLRLFGAVVY